MDSAKLSLGNSKTRNKTIPETKAMNLDTLIPPSPVDGCAAIDPSGPPIPVRLRRILVVDDDEVILNLISTVLAEAGFDVDAAPDGQEAWEALASQKYDLLVTDNEMPRLAGL